MASRAEKLLGPYLAGGAARPNGDLDMHCPIHGDARRSATINFRTGEWYCHACEDGGSLNKLLHRRREWNPPPTGAANGTSGRTAIPLPDSARLDGWHESLMGNREAREWLEAHRGISFDTMQRYSIGWDGQRYMLPVYDEAGRLVNIRRYSQILEPKMLNWPGQGSPPKLYPISVLLEEPKVVVICEGEWDALIANQQGVPTITTTGGVKAMGRWRANWTDWFQGRTIYICLDRDADGRQATRRIADKLKQIAAKVLVIDLPYPMGSKKDLTDFFLDGGTKARLRKLAKPLAQPKEVYKHVEYEDLRNGKMAGRPVEIEGTLASVNSTQILLPKMLKAHCNHDWDPKRCSVCPVGQKGGNLSTSVDDNNDLHLELFTVGSVERRQILFRKILGAPSNCPKVTIEVDNHSAWDCEIRNGSNLAEQAYPIVLRHEGNPPNLNGAYKFRGRLRVSPRGQRAVFMATGCEPAKQDLDSFVPDQESILQAGIWRDSLKGRPHEKLEQIAEQLELHTTRIFGQRLLHMAIDLVYHSIPEFDFGGTPIPRGWMEVLAVGETRSGKSTTAQRLQQLYARGFYQSAENATVAGLLFGVEKRASMSREGNWTGSVGVLPLNHRQLVVIDEAQGLKTEQIGQMSDMRSRGKVQIAKIRGTEVDAKVRLIWLANGRSPHYANGITALQELMGADEDLARIDIPLFIKGDIGDELGKARQSWGPLPWPPDILQWLVLWAWSRKAEHVRWGARAVEAVWDLSENLSEQFSTRVPILPKNEANVRLARMAVALAARLFSTKDGEHILVTTGHVTSAYELFVRFLGAAELGLVDIRHEEDVVEAASEVNDLELREFLKTTPIHIRQHLESGAFSDRAFGHESEGYITKLTQMYAVHFNGREYTVYKWAQQVARELRR